MPPGGSFGWFSLAAPLAAVALALWTRQVYLSLILGVLLGQVVALWPAAGWAALPLGLRSTVDAAVGVCTDADNVRVIFFVTLVGAVLLLAQRTGGVDGFVAWMARRGLGESRRGAQLFILLVGGVVFVETSISCLATGAVGRPLGDRLRISREKLAFLCDSTSAPVCAVLPFNAWGALILGLLARTALPEADRVGVLLGSIPLNFYSWAILGLALAAALTGWDLGPMRRAETRARLEGKLLRDGARPLVGDEITRAPAKAGLAPRARHFVAPLAVMLAMMPVGLFLTGLPRSGGAVGLEVMMRGSGSTAVLWAVLAALVVAVVLARVEGRLGVGEALDLSVQGAGGLASMALLMILAFAMGDTCKALGTGPFVKSLLEAHLSGVWLAPLLFLASCVVSFATGTSFGTLSIMLPIGVPAALGMGVAPALALAAVLSGAVFGDHCSPISDTTLLSSMAAASDHVDHVRTQLPYALLAAGLALAGFLVAGL